MKPDDVCKLFSRRHSVRSFSSEDIDLKQIGVITKCGLMAPCAMGIHASHLFVFQKGDLAYDKLVAICTDNGRNPFYEAPLIIIEAVDPSSVKPVQDGSAVLENILLSACFLGLGATWINAPAVVFNNDRKLLKQIGIDPEYQVIGSAVIGHPSTAC